MIKNKYIFLILISILTHECTIENYLKLIESNKINFRQIGILTGFSTILLAVNANFGRKLIKKTYKKNIFDYSYREMFYLKKNDKSEQEKKEEDERLQSNVGSSLLKFNQVKSKNQRFLDSMLKNKKDWKAFEESLIKRLFTHRRYVSAEYAKIFPSYDNMKIEDVFKLKINSITSFLQDRFGDSCLSQAIGRMSQANKYVDDMIYGNSVRFNNDFNSMLKYLFEQSSQFEDKVLINTLKNLLLNCNNKFLPFLFIDWNQLFNDLNSNIVSEELSNIHGNGRIDDKFECLLQDFQNTVEKNFKNLNEEKNAFMGGVFSYLPLVNCCQMNGNAPFITRVINRVINGFTLSVALILFINLRCKRIENADLFFPLIGAVVLPLAGLIYECGFGVPWQKCDRGGREKDLFYEYCKPRIKSLEENVNPRECRLINIYLKNYDKKIFDSKYYFELRSLILLLARSTNHYNEFNKKEIEYFINHRYNKWNTKCTVNHDIEKSIIIANAQDLSELVN